MIWLLIVTILHINGGVTHYSKEYFNEESCRLHVDTVTEQMLEHRRIAGTATCVLIDERDK